MLPRRPKQEMESPEGRDRLRRRAKRGQWHTFGGIHVCHCNGVLTDIFRMRRRGYAAPAQSHVPILANFAPTAIIAAHCGTRRHATGISKVKSLMGITLQRAGIFTGQRYKEPDIELNLGTKSSHPAKKPAHDAEDVDQGSGRGKNVGKLYCA